MQEENHLQVKMQEWPEHPWRSQEVGFRLNVMPIKDRRNLHLVFPLPDDRAHKRSQPSHYICKSVYSNLCRVFFAAHLLGHEGAGSLLSELKRRGWATSLSAGGGNHARGFGFFNVDVQLSEGARIHCFDFQM